MWPFSRKKRELNSAELRDRFQKQGQWAMNLINDFSAYIEDTDLQFNVRDVSKLPWPKDDLIRAFTFGLSVHPDGELREAMKITLLALSQFQPNVGEVDLGPMPRLTGPVGNLSAREMIAAMTAHEPIQKAYQLFQPKVESERAALYVLCEQPSMVK